MKSNPKPEIQTIGELAPAMNKVATANEGSRAEITKYLPWGIAGLVLWWLLYHSLAPFAAWFTYSLCGLVKGSHLGIGGGIFRL